MPVKTTRDDVVITNQSSTASDDVTEIGLQHRKNLVQQDEVQFGIGTDDQALISKNPVASPSQKAREFLASYRNHRQAKQAIDILDRIDKLISEYGNLDLPQFDISRAEDRTIGLTWKIADATLGIGIDPVSNKSSWFLLIGEDNRGVTAFGNLGKFDVDLLFDWIVFLIERIQRKDQAE